MPKGLPDINLLPKYERQSSKHFILFIAVIIILFISYLSIGVYYFIAKNNLTTANQVNEQLDEEIADLQLHVHTDETDSASSLGQAVQFAENHSIPTSVFIQELYTLLPENSYLSEYEYKNQLAEVAVHFEALDVVADYTTSLSTSNLIIDTKVDKVEAFQIKEEPEVGDEKYFDVIPRYETTFTLKINKQNVKGAATENE